MKRNQKKFIAFFTSIILFVSLLCESAVPVKADSNALVELKPYQTDNAVLCTAENGKKMVMMGEEFTEGFYTKTSYGSMSGQYNLGKKYDTVTFTVGHIDNKDGSDRTLTISVDGEEVKSIPLSRSMMNQTETIEVKGASQLSFYVNSGSGYAVYGVADVRGTLSSDYKEPVDLSNFTFLSPYQKTNAIVCTAENGEKMVMMGEEFTEGFYTKTSYSSMSGQYNLGKKYDTVRFTVGHVDNKDGSNRTLTISIDGEEIKSIPLSYSMMNQTETINVKGASQLSFYVNSGSGYAVYGVANVCASTSGGSAVPISRVDLDTSSVSMKVGEEKLLTASIFPGNATDKTLTWKSTDTGVATVSQNGLVKAVAEGKTTVTVTSRNNVTASCVVTVSAKQQGSPANPVHHCTKQDDGTDTTDWSYVYFGSYPQTEVTGNALTSAITGASYDASGDAWVNGIRYRRISKSDTTNTDYFGDSAYRYFKWERMKWRVLKNDGNTLFVVADKGLDCKAFHEENTLITWENCMLRSWLNSFFYNKAFSSREHGAIVEQNVGGNNINDKVSLLSSEEAANPTYGFCENGSLRSASRYIKASDYAHAMGAYRNFIGADRFKDNCRCWLRRSSGTQANFTAIVYPNGEVSEKGSSVNDNLEVVVPALHIDLSSDLWSMEDEKEHTHSFSTAWKSDAENHWKECECGEKSESSRHIFNWIIDKPATETSTGLKHEECKVCFCKRNEGTVIDKLTGEHIHSFSTAWQSNSEVHWKECECGEKSEYASHSFIWVIDEPATEASTGLKHEECEVCSCKRNEGTMIDKLTGEHTHSYKEWGRDIEAHWLECECGDKIEMEPHFFYWVIDEPATEASTGLKHEECEVCSYKRNEGTVIDKLTGEHTHSYREWGRNVEAHWKECECGDTIEMEPHFFYWVIDEPATKTSTGLKHEECKVCSYKRSKGTVIDKLTGEHTHSFSASWRSDAKNHWIECECGEKFAVTSHSFTWVIDKPASEASTGLKHEECSVCGYKRNKNTVIGKLGNTPVKGQKLTDRKSGAAYKVVIAKTKGGTVEYTKPLNNKTANISIPSTVKINGISYKVTSIAANAFKNNKKVTKVKIGSNVISIGKEAFRGCSKLKNLTIGNNVTSIGDMAFRDCTLLKTVTIPAKVKKIGKGAFYGCKRLKTIKISTKKLASKNVGNKAFAKIDPKATVKVPSSCLKFYKKLLQKKGLNGKKQKIKK